MFALPFKDKYIKTNETWARAGNKEIQRHSQPLLFLLQNRRQEWTGIGAIEEGCLSYVCMCLWKVRERERESDRQRTETREKGRLCLYDSCAFNWTGVGHKEYVKLADDREQGRLTLGEGVDLDGLTGGLVGLGTSLGVDKVRSKDGVDEGALSQSRLTCYSTNECKQNEMMDRLLLVYAQK